ncbi:hypothetical protein D3C79_1067610 [compost metagenome]
MSPARPLMSEGMKRKNQPCPSGEALTSSGSCSTASLTATTTPSNGMVMLLAAFTDSSTATSWPALYACNCGNWT